MIKLWAFFICAVYSNVGASSLNDPNAIGKITYVRGTVLVNSNDARVEDEIYINDKVKTEDKSVVKINFIDDSTLTVAPNSTITIDELSKGEKNLISILKGSLRAVVPKKASKELKNKMVLKSPSAAFGVRGTEFLVGHNQENKVSHIVTFSGEVKILGMTNKKYRFNELSDLLDKNGVSIKKGQFSTIDRNTMKFTKPVKISPLQFHSLKRNKNFSKTKTTTKEIEPKAKTRPIFLKNLPAEKMSLNPLTKERTKFKDGNKRPGGFLDLKTGTYLAPARDSKFDATTKVFIPAEGMGKIDSNTGEYIAPRGMKVTPEGTLKVIDKKQIKNKIQKMNQKKEQSSKSTNKQRVPLQTPPGINGESMFLNQQQNNTQQTAMPASTRVRLIITPN